MSKKAQFFTTLILVVALAVIAYAYTTNRIHAQCVEETTTTLVYPNPYLPGTDAYNTWGAISVATYGGSFGGYTQTVRSTGRRTDSGCGGGGGGGGGGQYQASAIIMVSPSSIDSGNSALLSWSSENAASCSINQGIGNVSPNVGESRLVNPSTTTTYTITCEREYGTGTVDDSTTLTVNPAPVPPPTATLTASPASITSGQSATLSYSSTNASACTLNQGVGSVTPNQSGNRSVSPTTSTTYTLTCNGNNGTQVSAYTTVTVSPPPPTATLTVSPSSITSGSSGTLSYACTNSTSASINQGVGSLSPVASGTRSVSPTTSTTYTLTCTGPGGSSTGTATLAVTPPPPPPAPTATLFANPTSITEGNSSTLTWSSTNATSCTGTNFSTNGATGGSLGVTPGTTTNYSVTCTGPGGSSTAPATVSVTAVPPALPDLTAGATTPTTATAGVAATFSATVSNIGSGPTGASFTDTFFIDTDTNDANGRLAAPTFTSGTPNGFPANYSEPNATVSYTFASPGTYYIRACADVNSSWSGTITESNEGNNCGPWTTITVSAPAQPDLTAGAITPTTATAGTPVTLSSTVSNIGTGPTSGGFPNNFQRANSAAGAGATSIGVYNHSTALSAPGSFAATLAYTFASAGTYYVRTCADLNAVSGSFVTESNEGNNCGPWTTITVTAPAQPDLTAGAITPTTATTGASLTLAATISNIGGASTGAGFTNLFQRANNASGSGATDIGTFSRSTAVTAGSQFTATRTYTFSTSGTYYVRACADKSSAANTGTITESDENNNCGPWTAVTVSSASQPVSSCTVNTTTLPSTGGSVTYSASGGTAPYTWTASGGSGSGSGSTRNQTYPATPGPYTMQVAASTGAPVNCPVVTVGTPSCGTADVSISASPDRVREGETTTISWSASGVDSSCTISGPGINQTIAGGSCTIPNGSTSVTITAQSVYTISCDGSEVEETVVVNVIPTFIEF